jgi:hypothetical protein
VLTSTGTRGRDVPRSSTRPIEVRQACWARLWQVLLREPSSDDTEEQRSEPSSESGETEDAAPRAESEMEVAMRVP